MSRARCAAAHTPRAPPQLTLALIPLPPCASHHALARPALPLPQSLEMPRGYNNLSTDIKKEASLGKYAGNALGGAFGGAAGAAIGGAAGAAFGGPPGAAAGSQYGAAAGAAVGSAIGGAVAGHNYGGGKRR